MTAQRQGKPLDTTLILGEEAGRLLRRGEKRENKHRTVIESPPRVKTSLPRSVKCREGASKSFGGCHSTTLYTLYTLLLEVFDKHRAAVVFLEVKGSKRWNRRGKVVSQHRDQQADVLFRPKIVEMPTERELQKPFT